MSSTSGSAGNSGTASTFKPSRTVESAGDAVHARGSELKVSGYTEKGYGAGPGMARYRLLADGSVGECLLEGAAVSNPSFMAAGHDALFAVEELPSGNVVALDPHTFDVLGRVPSGGSDSCHVAVVGDAVWAANYSSGNVVVVPVAALLDGTASDVQGGPGLLAAPELLSHPGRGPVVDRQSESHAHQVTATGWGTVLVSDLGADRVDEYSATSRDRLGSANLPPGTGPRHVALKGDFLLVAGELDGHLHVLQRTPATEADDASASLDAGRYFWHWLFKVPLAESAHKAASAPDFHPSHIQLSVDGSKLYAAVRGTNTVVVLDVSSLRSSVGTTGDSGGGPSVPRFLAEVSSGGSWPRHFALAESGRGAGKLYVANQLSNTICVFDLDDNGLPGTEPVQRVEFGSPACILVAG